MKRAENVRESFEYAFKGLWYALNTQRNVRIHLWMATLVMVAGWWLGLPREEFTIILLAIMVVMVTEMVNTAIESAVDLASPEFHRLAQIAKDVAAGAVLLAAIGAAGLGVWMFLPLIQQFPTRIVLQFNRYPFTAVDLLVVFAAVTGLVLWIPVKRGRSKGGS